MYKNLVYILILYLVNKIQNTFANNLIIFLVSLTLALVMYFFQKDILKNLKVKKYIITIIPILVFIPYFLEAFMMSSGYLNDLIVNNYPLMILVFFIRILHLIANILLFFIYLDYDKKYMVFCIFGILNSFLIWLELGRTLLYFSNLLSVIIFSIYLYWERKNENKN